MMATFREVQNRLALWVYVLIIIASGNALAGFIWQVILGRTYGSNPSADWVMWLLLILIGIGLPAMMFSMRLIIEVQADGVHIRYVPFLSRTIAYQEIASVQARKYNPIMEYGGWGIRGFAGSSKRAYSVRGNEGVELTLKDGKRVMLGSQQAQALAAAIQSNLK